MNLTDGLQIISLATVAVALVFNARLYHQAVIQANQTTRQAAASAAMLEQGANQMMVRNHIEIRASFLRDSPELLEWHLATRGYPTSSHSMNQRTLFALIKLETHETTFLSHLAGALSTEVWQSWTRVMEADLSLPEFYDLWPAARQFYVASFVQTVDEIVETGLNRRRGDEA